MPSNRLYCAAQAHPASLLKRPMEPGSARRMNFSSRSPVVRQMVMCPLMWTSALLAFLKDRGIGAAFHYVPLHTSPMGQRFGGRAGQLPVTEDIANRLLRLPMHAELSEGDVAAVIEAVTAFYSEA